jgi:cell wall-associated NlpC family hydrolase
MKNNLKVFFLLLLITMTFSCEKDQKQDISKFIELRDHIKNEYAPDKRVALFNIEISPVDGAILLKGESDQPKAVAELKQKLSDQKVKFVDSVVMLPDASVGETKFAVVNNSVANIRSQSRHSGELATQALLGMGLKVLKIKGAFYLVQTPDAYISWVDHGGVQLMNEKEYIAWNLAPKVIFTKSWGYSYKNKSIDARKVSDLVLGAQVKYLSDEGKFYKVKYPDGRIAFVKKSESDLYNQWIKSVKPSGELIEKYALDFMGTPYLWGGTSAKGMDCSGLTKTAYLMNGFIIPRDASQQINAGKNVDPDLKFENLQKGDLMFFGKKATDSTKQRVTHVGIWLGNGKGEFIHESKQVRLSSIHPESDYYDEGNTKRYLGSRRYLGEKDKLITNLKTDKVLTEIKQ